MMSIWKVSSVKEEPETILTRWRVFKVKGQSNPDETIHFVGDTGFEGRVCSAVQTYDPDTKRGITASGRIYELRGPSGHDANALYVWSRWCHINDIIEIIDITGEYDNG